MRKSTGRFQKPLMINKFACEDSEKTEYLLSSNEKSKNMDRLSQNRAFTETSKTVASENLTPDNNIRRVKTSQSTTSVVRPKYDFKNHKENFKMRDYCFFCHREFRKLLRTRHHCRLCCNSVCDDCSDNKVLENRVCDVCWAKHSNPELELEKKAFVKNLAKYA